MIANLEIHFGHSWKLILKAPLDAARNESATGGDASSLCTFMIVIAWNKAAENKTVETLTVFVTNESLDKRSSIATVRRAEQLWSV